MSLAAFHLVFVLVAGVFLLGLGLWGFQSFFSGGGAEPLIIGVLAIAALVALGAYGLRVRGHLRQAERGEES